MGYRVQDIGVKKMRCISVRQPYAWAICVGAKTVENRVWKTDFRGTIAIHASISPQYVNSLRKSSRSDLISKDYFSFGAIVGTADVVGVEPYGPTHESNPHARGPYCFLFANAKFFKTPIPMKGKLNLFHLEERSAEQVLNAGTASVELGTDTIASEIAELIQQRPDVAGNYKFLIDTFWDKGGEEVSAIQVAATRLVELEPQSAHGYFVRYMFTDRDHSESQCLQDARKMVELEPDSAMGYACLGWSLHLTGKNDEALVQLNRSLEISQDIPRAWYSRSEIHLALANYDQSLADASQALQSEPGLCEALLVRARCNFALGNKPAAILDTDAALEIAQDFEEAVELRKLLAE